MIRVDDNYYLVSEEGKYVLLQKKTWTEGAETKVKYKPIGLFDRLISAYEHVYDLRGDTEEDRRPRKYLRTTIKYYENTRVCPSERKCCFRRNDMCMILRNTVFKDECHFRKLSPDGQNLYDLWRTVHA